MEPAETESVSPVQQRPSAAPPVPCSPQALLGHTFAHVVPVPGMLFPDAALPSFSADCGHIPLPPELSSQGRTDASQPAQAQPRSVCV